MLLFGQKTNFLIIHPIIKDTGISALLPGRLLTGLNKMPIHIFMRTSLNKILETLSIIFTLKEGREVGEII